MAHSTAERKVQREEEFKRWRMAGEEVWQERKSSSKGRYSARKVQCEEGFESWKVSGEEDCGRGGLRVNGKEDIEKLNSKKRATRNKLQEVSYSR